MKSHEEKERHDREVELALRDADQELRARAREKMLAFSMYTMPDFEVSDFHRIVCHYLDKWVAKEIPNLIITGPPQHGKSLCVSRLLPAFIHGKFPDDKIIEATYSHDISTGMSRDVQAIIQSPEYQDVFPDTRLPGMALPTGKIATGKRTEQQYQVAGRRGQYYAVGVGEALTSRGGHWAVIDDPLKDAQEANSIVIRERRWNWYLSVLLTRMQKKGSLLITQTRWHEDDLVGRVLALAKANKDARQWVVLNFEALRETPAEKDTICGHPNTGAKHDRRKLGEALAPFRFDEKTLKQTRETIGPTWWQALYCGRPTSQAGAIIKREWIHHYRKSELPPKFDRYVTSWDFRFKKREESGDFVAGQAWARAKAKFYLLGPNEINERLGFLGSLAAVRQFIQHHKKALNHLIEKKANGDAIEETLENEIPRLLLVEPQGSKVERLQATEGLWAAGNVLLPHPDECPWILEWIEDLVGFPKRPHDDRVDAASQALLFLDQRGRNLLQKLTKG